MADHFYTTDLTKELTQGFSREGDAAYVLPFQLPETVPIYRWFNGEVRDHFFTRSPTDAGAIHSGFKLEKIVFYCYGEAHPGTVPFYQFYSDQGYDHFYTTYEKGSDDPRFPSLYHQEGSLCYVYPATSPPPAGAVALQRWFLTNPSSKGACSWHWVPGPSNVLGFECKN